MCQGRNRRQIIGKIVKQKKPWHQSRNRPLRIGGSIGHVDITAGTLGCFVTKNGAVDYVLSNNHVLANENAGKVGDRIIQPGDFDGGRNPADTIGRLAAFTRLKKLKNLVDCAIASLDEGTEYYFNDLETLGPITGVRTEPLDEGDIVFKVGRTTGVTKGRVSAIEVDQVDVQYDQGILCSTINSKLNRLETSLLVWGEIAALSSSIET